MAYRQIEVERVAGTLGAIVRGPDLGGAAWDAELDEIEAAVLEHHVVFLRDQKMSDERHLELAARFGPLSIYPVLKVLGGDRALEFIEDDADSPPKADDWHTDVTWIPEPPKYGLLSAQEMPAYGGDTLWCNLHAAYDALSGPMQEIARGLTVHHGLGEHFFERVEDGLGKEKADFVRAELANGADHPLVCTHPVTGRPALFVAGYFMQQINGMSAAESELLLRYFMEHATQARFQVRWRWQPHDLAIWDERCTIHMAMPDHYPQRRRVRRCTVDGERPYFEA